MLTEKIQATIDANVAGSPRARQLLTQLAGKTLLIRVRFTPWLAKLTATPERLLAVRTSDTQADAVLSGSPLNLLALAREVPAEVIRRGDVSIEGDSEVAEQFQELALLLRPDMEAELAQIIGEVPAFGAGQLLRRALDYGRSTVRTAGLNVGEYLAHERAALVPRAEADQFLRDVDTLRETTERLAVRVATMETGSPQRSSK
jgi:ubiquinone biosynthesis protein UbiJ